MTRPIRPTHSAHRTRFAQSARSRWLSLALVAAAGCGTTSATTPDAPANAVSTPPATSSGGASASADTAAPTVATWSPSDGSSAPPGSTVAPAGSSAAPITANTALDLSTPEAARHTIYRVALAGDGAAFRRVVTQRILARHGGHYAEWFSVWHRSAQRGDGPFSSITVTQEPDGLYRLDEN